jgi:DNA-directed RNA polymerase specialized sigma subunit
MTTYTVTATRWEGGWELDIDGVGVTQSHNLKSADKMIRSYLRMDLGEAAAKDADIEVTVDLDGLEKVAAGVRAEIDELNALSAKVSKDSRDLAARLKKDGLTGADAAEVMGISEQRFSQLIHA